MPGWKDPRRGTMHHSHRPSGAPDRQAPQQPHMIACREPAANPHDNKIISPRFRVKYAADCGNYNGGFCREGEAGGTGSSVHYFQP